MSSTVLVAAKINLHLRVAPPRADGFHPLSTWMTTVGLFDELTATESDQIVMTCDDPTLACDGSNLVMRAIAAVARETEESRGVRIELKKRIPSGGGLGGGSADAAATLVAVDRLWKSNLPLKTLDRLAATLGSDVNFFLHGPSSLCHGRGEHVRPIPAPTTARWAVLILPGIGMPTPAVFKQFDLMNLGDPAAIDEATVDWQSWARLPSAELLPRLVNDLERPAFAIRPELGELLDRLTDRLGRPVRMSGSGSTLFSLFDDEQSAGRAADTASPLSKCVVARLCPVFDQRTAGRAVCNPPSLPT